MTAAPLRVIIDPPAPGAWNMAVDEALLLSDSWPGPTLRFYEWQEPTLSLGYFQALAEREQHAASRSCAIVRRASGGGAILHDRELTYSLVAPVAQRFGDAAAELYDHAHQSLCEVLSDWKIAAHLCAPMVETKQRSEEPFLCFARRSAGDVLFAENKICGSAQRRHQSRVLQHGSLLLAQSPFAPELPGLCELAASSPELGEVRSAWQSRLAHRLQIKTAAAELTATETAQARGICEGKFRSPKWTAKR
jgi:lipoate-protein ligase A